MRLSSTWLVATSEYFFEIKRPVFYITVLAVPLLLLLLMGSAMWLVQATQSEERPQVYVLNQDDWQPLESQTIDFIPLQDTTALVVAQTWVGANSYLLHLPSGSAYHLGRATLYAQSAPSTLLSQAVQQCLADRVYRMRLEQRGLTPQALAAFYPKEVPSIRLVQAQDLLVYSAKQAQTATILGTVLGFIMYAMILGYGMRAFRKIMEEKQVRLLELLLTAVRPIELLTGKLLAALWIALTQVALWGIVLVGLAVLLLPWVPMGLIMEQLPTTATATHGAAVLLEGGWDRASFIGGFLAIQLQPYIGFVLLYLLFGYLLYAALFTVLAGLVGDEENGRKYIIIALLPLIFSTTQITHVAADASTSLAMWLSLVPLTAPIIMPVRLLFGVPWWQVGLSLFGVFGLALALLWFAARVLRVSWLSAGGASLAQRLRWLLSS